MLLEIARAIGRHNVGDVIDTTDVEYARQLVEKKLANLLEGDIPPKEKREKTSKKKGGKK